MISKIFSWCLGKMGKERNELKNKQLNVNVSGLAAFQIHAVFHFQPLQTANESKIKNGFGQRPNRGWAIL